jgi:hypothetical protein
MVDLLRLAGIVVLVLAVAAAAALVQSEWARDLGVDGLAPAVGDHVWGRRTVEPGEEDLAVQRRILEKNRVARELIDGRLTLVEGAATFRRLNAMPPCSAEFLPNYFAGDSEEERVCRQVILWVRALAAQQSAYLADVTATRLEEELSRHKARHGTVILPDVDAP